MSLARGVIASVAARLGAVVDRLAARVRRPLPLPGPGASIVWWNIYTLDAHYYQLEVSLDVDPRAHDGMPWVLDLFRDRQFYERKFCPDAAAALDLQAAWKRMAREHGLGRVYWVGSARMGRFDILIVPKDGAWRLLLFVKDRHAETRRYATEAEAIAGGHALEIELRNQPWLALDISKDTHRA
jgi:hypothetical protein